MGVSNKGLAYLLLRRKPVMLLIRLLRAERPIYASIVAKDIECTYSHTVRILQELKKKDIVEFEKKGRLKLITLTKKGREIAECLEKLLSMLNKAESK